MFLELMEVQCKLLYIPDIDLRDTPGDTRGASVDPETRTNVCVYFIYADPSLSYIQYTTTIYQCTYMYRVPLLKRSWSLVGACYDLVVLFEFDCISARKRENAGNADVRNLDNDFVADTGLLRLWLAERFLVLGLSWNGDGLL